MKKSIIYTRTGDAGTTTLVGGTRIEKHSLRLEAYGTIDELNSHIGLTAAISPRNDDIAPTLTWLQHRLFDIGGYLACDPDGAFTLPPGITDADITRTVCRRAERRITALAATAPVHPLVSKFINRLSDYLFVLARFNNVSQNIDEIFWQKDC